MPSDPKLKSGSNSKTSSSSKKPSSSSSSSHSRNLSTSSSSSSRSSSSESRDDKLTSSYLKSHAGFLRPLILFLSTTTTLSPTIISLILLIILAFLHLYLPLFLIPHLSAPITLLIPIQNTIHCIVAENGKKKSDGAQWCLYWIIYCLTGWIRGAVQIWWPGYRGMVEIGRTSVLVLMDGPWFGRMGLRPESTEDRPSGSSSEKRSRSGSSGRSGSSKDEKRKNDDSKRSK
ncbi:hypothetical protein L486_01045 [Kwoniella mangroviensis CBS 10435]|uniref:Uncharacterized protein n=1 Tax=Kwoniella mangroviensis CBS 10435 TaxID=1331196 RepID=A0A1B9J0T9_9TREE|nr:hypothetical protein L486_01045 [Kwoniella mangroviensis CBS 10435]